MKGRHLKRCHPGEASNPEVDQDYQLLSTEPKKKRTKIACDKCRKRKLRCNGICPCEQCGLAGSLCIFNRSSESQRSESSQSIVSEAGGRHDPHLPLDRYIGEKPATLGEPRLETLHLNSNLRSIQSVSVASRTAPSPATDSSTGQSSHTSFGPSARGYGDSVGSGHFSAMNVIFEANEKDGTFGNQAVGLDENDIANDFWQIPIEVRPAPLRQSLEKNIRVICLEGR